MADFKRITFTVDAVEYELGYHEWAAFDYSGNTQTRVIPQATGVKIWDTDTLGGGEITITVNVFVQKDSRLLLEQHIYTLIGNIKGQTGTLTIDTSWELTNCTMESLSMSQDCNKHAYFTIVFKKSV